MAGRVVKCQHCNGTVPWGEKDTMEIISKTTVNEETGKSKTLNKYYHKEECYEKHLKRQSYIDKEMKEKDELNEVVKSIHGLIHSPKDNRFWTMLEDLRNGTNRFEKFWKKRYREGIPYPVIKEAYLIAKGDIEWAKLNKRFTSTEVEMRYCLLVAGGKINDAYRKIKRTEMTKKMSDASLPQEVESMIEDRVVEWKNKKSKSDMSHILGDD